ncbi:MAG: TPR end-of-group domain-containing protein [Longimicrobiales bacterium]
MRTRRSGCTGSIPCSRFGFQSRCRNRALQAPRTWVAGISLVTSVLVPGAVESQTVDFTPGRVLERVVSPSDSDQQWALYVPSSYDPARPLPILFLMDPRGRALLPLERVRAAAERFGWAVISSYNTMSDGPAEPNVLAMNAMLEDAQSILSVNTRRFYIAGFSGTARIAWALTPRLDSAVAGIFGVGAGTPVRAAWLAGSDAPRVDFFGAAGTTDFNYDEVMGLERWLRTGNHTWALRAFDGAHEWAPAGLFDDAIAWFELQAMRRGREPPRQALIDSLYGAWIARADSLTAIGLAPATLYALDLADEIARNFRGVHDIASAEQRAQTLRQDAATRSALERRRRFANENADFNTRFFDLMAEVRRAERPVSAQRVIRDLQIDGILDDRTNARADNDPMRADAAQRKLETVFMNTSFYAPRTFLDQGRAEHALAILDVADRIDHNHPRVLYTRAVALVKLARTDDALSSLEAAVRAGFPVEGLGTDASFDTLRDHPRFIALTHRSSGLP